VVLHQPVLITAHSSEVYAVEPSVIVIIYSTLSRITLSSYHFRQLDNPLLTEYVTLGHGYHGYHQVVIKNRGLSSWLNLSNGSHCGKILLFAERSSSCRVLLAEGSLPRREQFTIRFAGTLSCCALFVSPKMIRFALKMLAELAVPH